MQESCVDVQFVDENGTTMKSSFSNSSGNCVDVDFDSDPGGWVQVQDTKLGEKSPKLLFTPEEWEAFIKGVKAGEFDL